MSNLQGDWLALDTSTAALTIALMRDGQVIAERSTEAERNHSLRLLPDVQELLSAHGRKAADLSGIAVGHGPGSYTGIRVAVTAAKTLAWSLKLPLIGISSLEALAYGAAMRAVGGVANEGEAAHAAVAADATVVDVGVSDAGRVWVVPYMDARRGKAYTALYEWSQGVWRVVETDGIRMLDSWLDEVRELAREQHAYTGELARTGELVELIGNPVTRLIVAGEPAPFQELLGAGSDAQGNSAEIMLLDREPLQARYIGLLADRYGLDRATTDAHGFVPNYTQLSEPERIWQSK